MDRAAGVVHGRHLAAGRQRFGQSLREQADATARVQNRLPAVRREAKHLLALKVQADNRSSQRLVAVFVDDAVDERAVVRAHDDAAVEAAAAAAAVAVAVGGEELLERLAEREGFEPSRGFSSPTRLAGERFRPLSHLSNYL